MSEPFKLLETYSFALIIYWCLYLFLRPRIDRGRKYTALFLGHTLIGLFLALAIPFYISSYTTINRTIILAVIFAMSISLTLHHLSVLRDKQEWRGIFAPRDIKVPKLHGVLSHVLYGASFSIYGLLMFWDLATRTNIPIEKVVLYSSATSMQLGGIFCIYLGTRMFTRKRK